MKIIKITLMISILSLTVSISLAGDLTGVGARALLSRHNISMEQLDRSGHKLLLGDLTGVGKKLQLEKISLYLTENEVVSVDKIDFIKIKNNERFFPRVDNHGIFKFNDIIDIKLQNKTIRKEFIQGLIIAK